MEKCIFLDRDGVLNVERGEYTFRLEDFEIEAGVGEALKRLKDAGYRLVVITNQAGIAKGLYTKADVLACHEKLQANTGRLIDAIYYCPHHPTKSESIARKPGTLMFERAIAKYNIDPIQSFMVGDQERDLVPAKKLGMGTVRVAPTKVETDGDHFCFSLLEASDYILKA
ncbi:HAD family hydrolase [Persicobacter psychrovividus]|uniref:D,D-heptose 1,7-bisphosphate phosphatase n=1 Tax=Persicobacter psychrovividus TaxID=387638 RepID=A0ABN6L9U4_9BACT|nr:D-glycero-alpha-D-manno-heptose-1,7-bisphosphate 7-phosphatase [Persicobacter psychrovividus]